jgi:hypothetical protein
MKCVQKRIHPDLAGCTGAAVVHRGGEGVCGFLIGERVNKYLLLTECEVRAYGNKMFIIWQFSN